MIKPVFYIILFLLAHYSLGQQNLVPNPSFEDYYSCPVGNDLNDGQLELCKGWWKPTMGTSDYFNRCNSNVVNVPNNFWGYQEAFQGDGYIGLFPIDWYIVSGEYFGFEYIQTQLIHPLIPCVEYYFEMQVNFANYSRFGISKLGALFTENAIHINNWDGLTYTPQVINNQGFLTDTANWITVSGSFVASGNEQYLCIGYFFDNVQNDTVNFQPPIGFPDEGGGYYYIDNVLVIEMGAIENCLYEVPNFFSPNNDETNDVWQFTASTEGHLEIINRWGNTVYQSDGYSFSWDGGDCVEGVYFYHYTTEKETKTGFIELIR